jgi:hypothetical protein
MNTLPNEIIQIIMQKLSLYDLIHCLYSSKLFHVVDQTYIDYVARVFYIRSLQIRFNKDLKKSSLKSRRKNGIQLLHYIYCIVHNPNWANDYKKVNTLS